MMNNNNTNTDKGDGASTLSITAFSELIAKYNVSQEDVEVAKHLVGNDLKKIEDYLKLRKNNTNLSLW